MSTSVPENTVDAWVAHEVLVRLPGAWVWLPTQRSGPNPHDLAATSGMKTFIVENKASTWTARGQHKVVLRLGQLAGYLPVRPRHQAFAWPVFYVLPDPVFHSPGPSGALFPQGPACRDHNSGPCAITGHSSAHDFVLWAFVIRADLLMAHIRSIGTPLTSKTVTLRGSQIRSIPGVQTLAQFLASVAQCQRVPISDGTDGTDWGDSLDPFVDPNLTEPPKGTWDEPAPSPKAICVAWMPPISSGIRGR
jgi:hypothetical protein